MQQGSGIFTEWDNVDYQINISDNYRKLKKFTESSESDTWIFKPRANEYLEQIKFFSKIDIQTLYPDYDAELMLEQLDVPFPATHKQYFAHLVLQLTFFRPHRLENLLDFHLNYYCKAHPNQEETFLAQLEHNTCSTIEHNEILDYQARLNTILQWIRATRIRLQSAAQTVVHIMNVLKNDFQVINNFDIRNIYNPPAQEEVKQKPQKPRHEKTGLATTFTPENLKKLTTVIAEFIEIGEGPNALEKLEIMLKRAVQGKSIGQPFIIEERKPTALCKAIHSLSRTILSKESKASLAKWIVYYFRKREKDAILQLEYKYIYKVIRG